MKKTGDPDTRGGRGRPLLGYLVGLVLVGLVLAGVVVVCRASRARSASPELGARVAAVGAALRAGALVVAGCGGLFVAYQAGRSVYDDVHSRMVQAKQDQIGLRDMAQQADLATVREIQADARGRYPLLYGVNGVIRDPASLRAFTLETVIERWPYLDRVQVELETVRQLVQMKPPGSYHYENIIGDQLAAGAQELVEELGEASAWRQVYPISRLLAGTPSLEELVIGVRPGEDGGVEVVRRSLHDLMHVLAVGASGWGKSTWLRAFLYQVAQAREACEVCAIDTSGSALNALRGWGKLRFPVARSAADACAVLDRVSGEIANRRQLFEQYPTVENLREYNQASGQDLPPWVIVADESTHLLHHKGIGEPLRDVVQTARQYGLYLLLAGQTAKTSVIDSEIRDQFSSRLCFHTSPPSSRTVLDDSGAASIHEKGRAIVRLVGTELLELQGPWVSKDDFMSALGNGGPRHEMPVVLAPEETPSRAWTEEQEERVLALHAAGESDTAIAGALWHPTSYYIQRVRSILAAHEPEPPQEGDPEQESGTADWCEFCDSESGPFSECAGCGVAVCDGCAAGGLCPDCQEAG